MEDRVDMHIKGGVPGLGCQLQQAPIDRPACRVDQNIDGAKFLSRLLDAARSLTSERHIGKQEQASAAQPFDAPPRLFRLGVQPPTHDGHIGTLLRQSDRGSGPNPLGASGHQSDGCRQELTL